MKPVLLLIALLVLAAVLLQSKPGRLTSADGIEVNRALGTGTADTGFERAETPRVFEFPRDHGAHNSFRNEWWYFTGNLSDEMGKDYGFQFVIFRIALRGKDEERAAKKSLWRNRQLYMSHLALTEVDKPRFIARERFSRPGAGLAGASEEQLDVWLENWRIRQTDASGRALSLTAQTDSFSLQLQLDARKPVVLNGNQGLSQKSADPGNASYYYSVPRLSVSGSVSIDNEPRAVTGDAWFDREWSTSALARDQLGWDWFSLQFADGSELMLYQMRQADGSPGDFSAGTYIDVQGSYRHLSVDDFEITVKSRWTSPETGKTYPARWQVRVPSVDLDFEVTPRTADQELALTVIYWEGAVALRGKRGDTTISGRGYVELAGY